MPTVKLESVTRKKICRVELLKNKQFSYTISLSVPNRGLGLLIKKIKPEWSKEKCHTIAEGDVVLAMDGLDMTLKSLVNLQDEPRVSKRLSLKLQYNSCEIGISGSDVYRKRKMVTKLEKVNGSFGFVLRWPCCGRRTVTGYPVISNISRGGPAAKGGLLQEGDRLLKIDNVSLFSLSHTAIECILQTKKEAVFTFEYNIHLHDFSKFEKETVSLELKLPTSTDVGLEVSSYASEPHGVLINNIRKGSIAERCGLFNEGDIITSINGVSTELLSTAQVGTCLRCPRRMKMSFVSTKASRSLNSYNSTMNSKTLVEAVSNCSFQKPTSTASTQALNSEFESIQKLYLKEQVKAIQKLRDAIKHLTLSKESLLLPIQETFMENNYNSQCNCIACKRDQGSTKPCDSCVDVVRNIIAHLISVSLRIWYSLALEKPPPTETAKKNVPQDLIRDVKGILLREVVNKSHGSKLDFVEEIVEANASCGGCKNDIDSVSIQKLLMSVIDPFREAKFLINHLVYCLETKLPSDTDVDDPDPPSEENVAGPTIEIERAPANFTTSSPRESGAQSSEMSEFNDVDLNESLVDNNDDMGSNSGFRVKVDLSHQSAYLKLVDVSTSGSEESRTNILGKTFEVGPGQPIENPGDDKKDNVNIKSSSRDEIESPTRYNKNKCKDKNLLNIPGKIWRSLDSFLRSRRAPNTLEESTSGAEAGCSRDYLEVPNPSFNHRKSVNNANRINRGRCTESNLGLLQSSAESQTKTHKETVEVRMSNSGKGFGIVLGFSSQSFSEVLPVPVITDVKRKSSAERIGIVAKGDRVLAINKQLVADVPLRELESLKRRAFSASTISLLLEFDVVDAQPQFGIFDVVLEKTLKIGLIFDDLNKGKPMVVVGVEKGSAAHRSGRIFPGDRALTFKGARYEEFHPVTCNYSRQESVTITIKRENLRGTKLPEAPPNSAATSSSRAGAHFVLRQKTVRPIGGSGTVVLDFELTLFRDPVSWDFGFLVGENPVSGRAFVTGIKPRSPASEIMKKMDRIVEVNGVTVGREDCSVLSLLTLANDRVDLLIRRIRQADNNVPRPPHEHRPHYL